MSARSIPLGRLLLAWIAITALIALNRGIDLLCGVVLLLTVATATAALLPKLQVRGVSVRRASLPKSAVVGVAESIAYQVEVRGPWARYGIEILDRLDGETSVVPTAFIAGVRGARTFTYSWTPRMRGAWQLRDLIIESRYPLGLTRARRVVATEPVEIVVYPDFVRLHWLPVQHAAHPRFEQLASPRRGGHDEFFGLKPYRSGDERRNIHWRSSARAGEWVVKEYEHQQDRRLWIVLDLAETGHEGSGPASTCEDMIRIAHSIAVKAQESEIPVGLLYRVADAVHQVSAAADRGTYLQIRDALARVNTHAQLPLATWLHRSRDQLPSGGTWVLFNLGDLSQRSRLESIVQQRAATSLFVEFDKHSYAAPRDTSERIRTHASSRAIVTRVPCGADLSELFKP